MAIEDFLNRLTDMDWGWWPFLFLRPLQDELIDTRRVAKMTLYFGPMFSIILIFYSAMRGPVSLADALATAIYMCVFFFVWYRLTFAVAWNRRARRLQNEKKS